MARAKTFTVEYFHSLFLASPISPYVHVVLIKNINDLIYDISMEKQQFDVNATKSSKNVHEYCVCITYILQFQYKLSNKLNHKPALPTVQGSYYYKVVNSVEKYGIDRCSRDDHRKTSISASMLS